MTQSSSNVVIASVLVLVVFALGVAWYINTHPAPVEPPNTATSSI